MTTPPNKLSRFWQELKRRKVIHVIVVYATASFVLIELTSIVEPSLGLPDWTLNLVIILLCIGFPFAIIFSWIYDVSSKGITKTEKAEPEERTFKYENSIAVLPFQDMSPTKDQEYFCDGIAEEILNALCKIPRLRVVSRVTSFSFAGSEAGVEEIGQRLNVQTVLEGSVRKSGERLRITAQLVKTADSYHLWSRQYDRGLEDIFEIQEEIARSIADALSVTFRESAMGAQQVHPKAYDYFLRGLSYFGRHTMQDTVFARQMFERALEVDPDFGRAWAGLAYTYGMEQLYFNASNVNRDEALRTSQKALELAPERSESHVSAGIAQCMVQAYDKAQEAFERAMELDPED